MYYKYKKCTVSAPESAPVQKIFGFATSRKYMMQIHFIFLKSSVDRSVHVLRFKQQNCLFKQPCTTLSFLAEVQTIV
jgi:hypothetical protein